MPIALIAALLLASPTWVWPLTNGAVERPFVAPSSPFGPGHRGIDIGGSVGQQVRAINAGTVTFSGLVAEKSVVVVRHGPVRSTYEPVAGSLSVGTRVQAGEVIGTLLAGHCPGAQACLHLGLRRGDTYLDPLRLFQRVVLKSPARG